MKTRQTAPALLTGIIRCGHCGKAMGASHTKRDGKRYRYYVCNHAERNGYDAYPVRSVPAGQIEGAVKGRIRVVLRSSGGDGRGRAIMEWGLRQDSCRCEYRC